MPKHIIDYTNTTIYKLTCKDKNVTDIYIGYTTNFIQKKYNHKQNCTNVNSSKYNCELYKKIRQSGGWDNWKMEVIKVYKLETQNDAIQKENEHINLLRGTNTVENMIKQHKSKISNDQTCEGYSKNILCDDKQKSENLIINFESVPKNDFWNQKSTKKEPNFYCEKCDFTASRKSHYDRHLQTKKHFDQFWNVVESKKVPNHICSCGKQYQNISALNKHKKKYETNLCNNLKDNSEFLLLKLLDQNNEFKCLISEQNKQLVEQNNKILDIYKNTPHTTTTITNNNKTFNLNLFLNETCKNAMNINDFIESIKLQLSDLEKVGEIGFIEGISNIILNRLKVLDITQRPIHCTDPKREIMYIKDENKWEKENQENNKLRRAIKNIAHKNTKLLTDFKEKYPDYGKSESVYSDKYNKLIIEAMGGKGNNELEKEDKIIKNIVKEVLIIK